MKNLFNRESKTIVVDAPRGSALPPERRRPRLALVCDSRLNGVALLFVLLLASPVFAIVPPIPPIIVIPNVPEEKPAEEPEDVSKLADRITKNAKGITDKLADQDTGETTRKDQKNLKQDIDKLIDLLQNQPPPPMPMPMSGGGGGGGGGGGSGAKQPMGGKKPMGGSQRTGSGRRQQNQQPMGGQPMPMGGEQQPMGNKGQPMPMGGQPMGGQPMGAQPIGGQPMGGNQAGMGGKPNSPELPLAETIAKDLWGHLPELPRQRMMQFFREQYNSKYKDLLPDYFSTLSEKEKKGKK